MADSLSTAARLFAPQSRAGQYVAGGALAVLAAGLSLLARAVIVSRFEGLFFLAAVASAAIVAGGPSGTVATAVSLVLLGAFAGAGTAQLALFGLVAGGLTVGGAALRRRWKAFEMERDRATHLADLLQQQAIEVEQQNEEAQALTEELEESNALLQHAVRATSAERDAAEGARARTAAIVQSALDCIITMDQEGRIVEFNPAAERTFGYARVDAIGKLLGDLIVPPRLRDAHRRGLARYLATGEATILGTRIEMPAVRADGTEFPAELAVTRVPVSGPALFTGYLRDLSEARRTAGALAFLAEASRILSASLDVDATLGALARLAIADLADGCLISLVEEASGELAFRHAAVASRDPEKAALVEDMERRFPLPADAPTGYPHVIRTGSAEIVEPSAFEASVLPSVARNAEHLALLRRLEMYSAMIVPLNARGRTIGAITLVRHGPERRPPFDSTDLARAEDLGRRAALALDNARLYAQERQARREAENARAVAEAASRTKSEFLAVMSHEFRTPLNAIIGYEELLADGITGPVSLDQLQQLERIKVSAAHLRELVDSVLSVARLDAGMEPARHEPVNVARAIEEAALMVAPLAGSKGLVLDVDVPDVPLVIDSDPGKVRQILVNLLGNAVKFTERGSVTIAARGDETEVTFVVRDTGIGIASSHLERIFEPFTQVEQSRTRTAGGTGLGLSVSRRFARLLGGDVSVESVVGEGSTFIFRVPRRPVSSSGVPRPGWPPGH